MNRLASVSRVFGLRVMPLIRRSLLLASLFYCAVAANGREYPPVVPPPKPFVFPVPAVRTLPNGLRVVVIERHSLPLITLRVEVKAGAEADPPDRKSVV